jgi:large subunit ribosomal protein L23
MSIIVKPIVSEKMTAISEKLGSYAFQVASEANKIEIKLAVEKLYNVNVVSVNTMVNNGKIKTRNTRAGILHGRVKRYKKAIVTLKKGETIDFFSSI